MTIFDDIAERRIQTAQAQGEFDKLPGMGRPLIISEDFSMPIEVRMAHRRMVRATLEKDRYSLVEQMRLRKLQALIDEKRRRRRSAR